MQTHCNSLKMLFLGKTVFALKFDFKLNFEDKKIKINIWKTNRIRFWFWKILRCLIIFPIWFRQLIQQKYNIAIVMNNVTHRLKDRKTERQIDRNTERQIDRLERQRSTFFHYFCLSFFLSSFLFLVCL